MKKDLNTIHSTSIHKINHLNQKYAKIHKVWNGLLDNVLFHNAIDQSLNIELSTEEREILEKAEQVLYRKMYEIQTEGAKLLNKKTTDKKFVVKKPAGTFYSDWKIQQGKLFVIFETHDNMVHTKYVTNVPANVERIKDFIDSDKAVVTIVL